MGLLSFLYVCQQAYSPGIKGSWLCSHEEDIEILTHETPKLQFPNSKYTLIPRICMTCITGPSSHRNSNTYTSTNTWSPAKSANTNKRATAPTTP